MNQIENPANRVKIYIKDNFTETINLSTLEFNVENQDANSSHFKIEKSTNGTDFIQGTVNATTNQKESYSHTDYNINLSRVSYRLKMVDKDIKFDYSDIISGQKGINEKSINLSSVRAGSYMIRIQAGQNGKTLSVIKN